MTISNPRATLALDDLLTHATGDDMRAIRGLMPAHVQDQLAAAHTDAEQIMRNAATATNTPISYHRPGDVDEWLRLDALEELRGFAEGSAKVCMHNPNIGRAEPIYACAWRPGLVVCIHCVRLLNAGLSRTEDVTCDHCGHVCRGVEHGEGIHSNSLRIGALTYMYGSCPECLAQSKTTHATPERTH